MVEQRVSIRWMKMGLRAQICSQCQRIPMAMDPSALLEEGPCEVRCPLFIQLPRLARFLTRHRPTPPGGYEEYALKLLGESPMGGPFLDYAPDALAILERIAALTEVPKESGA